MSYLVETQQLSFNNTTDSYATFGLDIQAKGSGVQRILVRSSADCYVDFDKAATTGASMLIKSSDGHLADFDFHGGSVLTVHAIGSSGSGTLYIVAIRN